MVMAYKALLVDAGLDDAAESRVRLAAGLAERFGAHLLGVAACGVLPLVTGPYNYAAVVPEIIEAEVQRVQAALAAAAERFLAAAGTAAQPAEWRAFVEAPGEALPREARAADLLVIGRGGAAGVQQATEPGDVLMRAGRPTLVVPPGIAALQARCVLVAWKEGREARRAVADALPFLAGAERVVVLEVCENEDERIAAQHHVDDVVALLSRHGARASGEVAVRHGRSASDELLGAAERLTADLIVAGGYGRARLLEWVFGGVTRDLLTRSPVCCLLSH